MLKNCNFIILLICTNSLVLLLIWLYIFSSVSYVHSDFIFSSIERNFFFFIFPLYSSFYSFSLFICALLTGYIPSSIQVTTFEDPIISYLQCSSHYSHSPRQQFFDLQLQIQSTFCKVGSSRKGPEKEKCFSQQNLCFFGGFSPCSYL